ncbi:hypothetical protein ACI5KX_07620 [Erythrobacter sp. GH1-10]|uniref:hypothetical protein n=1 Tax=Erythrobacter sp. GH1-10 TaxID=3349334 RepID=UPI003877E75A
MSYDFLVFDPEVPPRNDDGFREWFESEIRDGDDNSSSSEEVVESKALKAFYAEMREIFTPISGPDAVDLPASSPPIRQLRSGDYGFRPHSIYLGFRWEAADMARASASTIAKHLGLGFYFVSSEYGQAVFPDGHTVWPTGKYPGRGTGKKLQ